MQSPEDDIEDRTPVWDALQILFMDTDVTLSYDHIVDTRIRTGKSYSRESGQTETSRPIAFAQLRKILWRPRKSRATMTDCAARSRLSLLGE